MARPSVTAALLLLFSLLIAVGHCRPVEPQPAATDADESAAAIAGEENGLPNPTLIPTESADQVILPLPAEGFLRLPSHRLRHHHRPCRHGPFHRHLWLAARHHGALFGDEPRAVAEPDPDRSIPNGDAEVEEVASKEPSFGDVDGDHEEEGAAVRAWKKEMMRRWFHFHGHHGMRHHHRLHHGDEEESHKQEDEEATEGSFKRFHHRRDHDEDEEKDGMRKRFRHAEHDDSDSEDENEEVEEMVRRFRKAIMQRRFRHGRRFHHRHHHAHRHGVEADAQEEGGVVSWIKGLMNRF
ncbi:hypothetical protein HU200_012773 [Digitaria exilis]|uniref:Uncharacterized protein n=1 Tax=Digitaria exilis TaxID=1010633 RepID=A0A835KLL6_9POAL|nr:hypothetical protein HU200_012773 [Digitaria exilis]